MTAAAPALASTASNHTRGPLASVESCAMARIRRCPSDHGGRGSRGAPPVRGLLRTGAPMLIRRLKVNGPAVQDFLGLPGPSGAGTLRKGDRGVAWFLSHP